MPVVEWCHGKRSLQILFTLLFVQPCLGWGGSRATQTVAIHRYLQRIPDDSRQLLSLVVASSPLPPPVQGNRQQYFWVFVSCLARGWFVCFAKQAAQQSGTFNFASIFELMD